MEFEHTLQKYKLSEFWDIMSVHGKIDLPTKIQTMIANLTEEIVPIIVEKSPEKHYKKHEPKTRDRDRDRDRHKSSNGSKKESAHHHNRSRDRDRQKEKEDLSWENLRSFKITKIEKKEGKEKIFSDIRSCLNKLSTKNYDTEIKTIFQLLDEIQKPEPEPQPQSQSESETANTSESTSKPTTKKYTMQHVAESIFEIASTNMFYAEIYAKLYKELIVYNPLFQEVLLSFLSTYANSIKDLHYIDPDEDYEGYCDYNKKNEMRKATAVFVIHLMKENVLAVMKVLSLIAAFQECATKYVEEEKRTNEVEEIAEILYLFLNKGIDTFVNCKAEWIWKFVITKHVQTFSKYKKTDKKSISSRAIFKYMDMAQLIEKTESKEA